MSFLPPRSRPWSPSDFDLGRLGPLPADLLHVTKTACLLESRADQYGGYLLAVLGDRGPAWGEAVRGWNREEGRHGEALRRLCEAADPAFGFEAAFGAYRAQVGYHAEEGGSVRGSVGGELVARCVVEALATALYRVLEEGCGDPAAREVFGTLARDEARHYGMFLGMLKAELRPPGFLGRAWVAFRRMAELGDAQIMAASWRVDGAPGRFRLGPAADAYVLRLYGRYRWRHLLPAARMIWRALDGPCPRIGTRLLAAGLLGALQVRLAWARLRTRMRGLSPLPPRPAPAPCAAGPGAGAGRPRGSGPLRPGA